MSKKTKKSPSRKKTSKKPLGEDWLHLGKGTLSLRMLSDAEKAALGPSTESQLKQLQAEVDTLLKAAGGFWTTIDGTLLAIRDMSDNRLENALKMATVSKSTRGLLQAEQKRREKDKSFAKLNGKHSSNHEMDDLMERIESSAPTVGEVKAAQELKAQVERLTRQVDKLTMRQPYQKAEPMLAPKVYEVNGYRFNCNLSGRWFARKGDVLLAAGSYETLVAMVQKVTS